MGRNRKSSSLIFLTILSTSAGQFVPTARYAQNAVYSTIEDKVYFLGGNTNVPTSDGDPLQLSQDFFSLDLSKAFDITSPPYVQLPNGPLTAWAAAAMGFNDSSLWVIGGATDSCKNDTLVHKYDVATSTWSMPVIDTSAMSPSRRREYSAVRAGQLDTELFLFGGTTGQHSCSSDTKWYDGMDVLQTAPKLVQSDTSLISHVDKSQWLAVNASLPGIGFNDQAAIPYEDAIIYLGGRREDGLWQPMTDLLVFNTSTSEWNYVTATGVIPQERAGHTAVLTDDGQIVVYGGIAEGSAAAYPDLAVLDTTQMPWTWSTPDVMNAIGPRTWHSAIYRNNTMLLAFGMTMNDGPSNELHLLDLATMTWDTDTVSEQTDVIVSTTSILPSSTLMTIIATGSAAPSPSVSEAMSTASVASEPTLISASPSQLAVSSDVQQISTAAEASSETSVTVTSSIISSSGLSTSQANNFDSNPTLHTDSRSSATTSSSSPTSSPFLGNASAGQKAATVAAVAVTSVIGAAALALVGGLYYVKHRKQGSDTDSNSQLSLMRDPPPVSTLNYSRPSNGTENSRRCDGRLPKRSITPVSLLMSTRPANKRASRIDPSIPSSAESSLTSNYRRTSAALIEELSGYIAGYTPIPSPTVPKERERTVSVDMMQVLSSLPPPPRLKVSKSKSSQKSTDSAIRAVNSTSMSLPQQRRSVTSPPERGFSWVEGQDVIDFRRLQQPRNAAHPPWLTPGYGSPPPTFGRRRYGTLSETSSGDELEREMRERMVSISTVRTVPRMSLRVTNDV